MLVTSRITNNECWERKVLRKINGAVQERYVCRIRINQELKELYRDTDLVGNVT
ncbi:hypothetical protein C0J52_27344 [Blattella germanica]|nr:hypothetical protein C0J52_27344 [Blattella germanica]